MSKSLMKNKPAADTAFICHTLPELSYLYVFLNLFSGSTSCYLLSAVLRPYLSLTVTLPRLSDSTVPTLLPYLSLITDLPRESVVAVPTLLPYLSRMVVLPVLSVTADHVLLPYLSR